MNAKEIVLFESSDGQVTLPVEVDVAQGDVWLTRRQIAYLFGRDVKTIGKHINNALQEELSELTERTVAKIATVQKEKNRYVKRQLEHYGLDVVLAVGYRVKSQRDAGSHNNHDGRKQTTGKRGNGQPGDAVPMQ